MKQTADIGVKTSAVHAQAMGAIVAQVPVESGQKIQMGDIDMTAPAMEMECVTLVVLGKYLLLQSKLKKKIFSS